MREWEPLLLLVTFVVYMGATVLLSLRYWLRADSLITVGLGAPSPGAVVGKADKGELLFHFGAPQFAVRVPYRIVLEKQPQQPRWLADPGNPNSLLGEAIFGSSRGNDRIIYRREVMH